MSFETNQDKKSIIYMYVKMYRILDDNNREDFTFIVRIKKQRKVS